MVCRAGERVLHFSAMIMLSAATVERYLTIECSPQATSGYVEAIAFDVIGLAAANSSSPGIPYGQRPQGTQTRGRDQR